jgi:hypothetical protein
MPKTKNAGNAVNIIDPERFTKIRVEFAKRGLVDLSLSAMMRIVMDEWCDGKNKRNARKSFPCV